MATLRSGTVIQQIDRLFGAGTLAGLSDAQLLERFRAQRDEAAFEALVTRHAAMVLNVCRGVLRDPHDTEDAFQATILILVRKAGSLKVDGSIAGWLHRVAIRVAIQANQAEARRRSRERKAGEATALRASRGSESGDLRSILHSEIGRLPDSFRLPLVLCDLEGRSRAEAAATLNWSEGTVRGRLARGRARLRSRLARHGLAVTAGSLTAALADASASTMPEGRVVEVVRATLTLASEPPGLGAAVVLSEQVLRAIQVARLKTFAASAITALFVVGTSVGLVARAEPGREPGDGPPPTMKSSPPSGGSKMPQAPSKDETERPSKKPLAPGRPLQATGAVEIRDYEFKGTVIDPAGKPAAGVRLRLSTDAQNIPPWATTGPDGRFRFTVRGPSIYKDARVIAEADGHVAGTASKGFLYSEFPNTDPSDAGRELSVKLTADQPIEGRLVDLEGRPVADADVKVGFLFGPPGGDLTPWFNAVKAREGPADDLLYKHLKRVSLFDRYPSKSVKTDGQGRFRLVGLGRDRLAIVKIEASTIRPLEIKVLTRLVAPFQAMSHPQIPQFGSTTYYGALLQLAASPTRLIQGIVRDQRTGKPIAGASIQSTKLADRDVWNDGSASTTSDSEGRYRLTGMPRGAGNVIIVGTPSGPSYLPVQLEVQNPPGLDPIALDVELTKGVGIEGQVLDLRTRKPVTAWVTYHAAADNKNLDASPGFKANSVSNSPLLRVMTPPDGRFKLVGLPGRGAIVVEAQDRRYPGDDNGGMPRFDFVPSIQGFHQAVVSIDIPTDVEIFPKDIPLDSGEVVEGTVLDPEGQPLAGARVYGLQNLGYWENLADATFRVVALKSSESGDKEKGRPARSLVFLHEMRKLAGSVTLKEKENGPIRVRLEPWAVAIGRVVDPEGKPRSNLTLQITAKRPRLGGGQISHDPERIRTDPDGRFTIVGLAPNVDYSAYVQAPAGLRAKKRIEIPPTASGETRDLGTLTVEYEND